MRQNLFLFLLLPLSVGFYLFSEEKSDEIAIVIARSETIPGEHIGGQPDPYFEGYIQALIDMHYYEFQVVVIVKNGDVILANLPKNKLIRDSIISFVKDVPGVKNVKVVEELSERDKKIEEHEEYAHKPKMSGIWFPQMTELYLPMIANPRQVIYSIGYRGDDRVIGKEAVAVSLGDDFPIFRWIGVLPWKGDLQIGIESGIWSVFNMRAPKNAPAGGWTELVNTDFYVGIPLVYAVNAWAFRFRIYHISSHLGDEFLVNNPQTVRVNPSFEAIDFFISWQVNSLLRLYVGPGVIVQSDKSFPMDHLYFEYGGDVSFFISRFDYHKLYGNFFAAVYFRNYQFQNYGFDGTFMLGYEWSKLQGIGRKIRILSLFHHGYSPDGQFMKRKTTYWGLGVAYGF